MTTDVGTFVLHDHLPADHLIQGLRQDVHQGLTATPKTLPPKWFYDARGSALFEQITELPEYYPTRVERTILRARAAELAARTGAGTLVELGAGSATKTRLLLDALTGAGTLHRYVPVDVDRDTVADAARAILVEYPSLTVAAAVADFETQLGSVVGAVPAGPAPTLVAFLGSTIGNLEPAPRARFLRRVRGVLRSGDFLLLGVDLVKEAAVLVAAYDDAAGVTAEFNRNVLAVVNNALAADFDLDAFDHVARWDADQEWIEMRLRSWGEQQVRVKDLDLVVAFDAGEELRTEVSAKFRRTGVTAELTAAGFTLGDWWADPEDQFALAFCVAS